MHLLKAYHSTSLQAGHTFSFASHSKLSIAVDFGRVWITASGVQEDYWLDAGESLILAQNSHIVVQAEEKFACFAIKPVLDANALSAPGQRWNWLPHWLPNWLLSPR